MVLNQDGLRLLWQIIQTEIDKSKNSSIVDGIYFRDQENGYTYLLEFINGNLVSSGKAVSIYVTLTIPSDALFIKGEIVDPSYYQIIAHCEDGSEKILKGCDISTIQSDGTVAVSYEEMGTIYTDTINLSSYNFVDSITTALQDFTYNTNSDGTYTLKDYIGTSTTLTIPNNYAIIL